MSVVSIFGSLFGKIGKIIRLAFKVAAEAGLTDELVDLALKYVRVAATKTVDNREKREWVAELLVARGIPRSLAYLAIELAYQLYRKDVAPKLESN